VDGVAANLALDTRGANEVWKLGENSVDRRTATDDFHSGSLRTGSLGGADNEVTVQQAVVLIVHQEAEMGEEVGPEEGLCDVGHHEAPSELQA
jgi:hypothetical protein